MGKLQKIFYLFFTLSFALTLQAQDSLFFFQYPGQKYVIQTKVDKWGGGGGFWTYIDLGEVTTYKVLNGKQYFNNPFLKVPMAYQDGKIYWLKTGDIEMLLADITLPSGSTFTGAIPPHSNELLTIIKTTTTYRIEGDKSTLYLKKDFGLSRKYFSDSWGPPLPSSVSEDITVREMKYQKPDGTYFLYKLPVTVTTSTTFEDTLFTPSLKVDVSSRHQYSQGYSSGDFWESADVTLIYSKPGVDTIKFIQPLVRKYPEYFSSTLTLKDSLLLNGYRLKLYIELTDKGVEPNKFRYPETGGYDIKYFIRATDIYAKIPDFRNYYSRWLISNGDTTYRGVVEQGFIGDTAYGMAVYGREELFGEVVYIRALPQEDLLYGVYRNKWGTFDETHKEKHLFSAADPTQLHYLLMGDKKITPFNTYLDSTGGAISRVYHFKGGYRGDEEIKYKARTGPTLIIRYEPDSLGGSQKIIYKLWKVNNKGVVHIVDNHASPIAPALVPSEFNISHNYPNPFNPTTSVKVFVPEQTVLTFTLFNSNGEEVSSFTKDYAGIGEYIEEFDLSGFPSGAWFLSVRDDNDKQIKLLKLLYLK